MNDKNSGRQIARDRDRETDTKKVKEQFRAERIKGKMRKKA